MGVAVKNINNGVALTGAIEASLDEVGDILVRMQELAVQSASDSYSGADRQMMHDEVVALRNELTALSTRVEFGGQKILDGTYSGKQIQVGDSAGETIVITQGSVAAASIGGNRVVGTAHEAEVAATGDAAVDIIGTDGHDFEIT
jgi:flagellin